MKKINMLGAILLIFVMSASVVFAKKSSVSSGKASSFGSKSSFSSSGSKSSSSASYFKSNSAVSNSGKASVFGSGKSSSSGANLSTLFRQKNSIASTPNKRIVASDLKQIFSKDYQTNRRKSYYQDYHTPSYYQPMMVQSPSYGIWDSLMMWSILDNMGDRNMYYHHQQDPAFQQWRSDAQKLCDQGNKEICDKLSSLDKDVQELKKQGIKQDPSYITEGIDPSIYVKPDGVDVSKLGEVKICTGTASSDYSRFAKTLGEKTQLKIIPILSNGSIDNLLKLAKGECDMAFTQPDAAKDANLVETVKLDKPEATFLICNNAFKGTSYKELTDQTIYVGSDQTGSQYTLNILSKQLENFNKLTINNSLNAIAAAQVIETNDKACLFVVDTWDAPYITQLDKSKTAKLVSIDGKFDAYKRGFVDKSHYTNLDNYLGWFDEGVSVLTMQPVLVTTQQWIETNAIVFYDVLKLNKSFLKEDLK